MRYVVALDICLVSSVALGQDASQPKISLEPFVRGLQQPLYLTHDCSDLIFIVEHPGRIRLYQNGQLQKEPYLDIKP